jgi:glycosyltransferase involved in cell wall biosynthesis
VVVHNGVDVGTLTPAIDVRGVRAEFGFPADAQIVGTVARLVERRKAIGDFLDMAARLRVAAPRARFLVVGDGALRPELEAQARALGLADVVVFTGERADPARLMAAMSVFVIPSLYEGCQYALLEAMAIGRPVVATPAGVAPAVVRDGETGLLVPFGDPAGLAVAAGRLLADPSLAARLGAAGREAIVAGFSLDSMTDALTGLYAEVVSRA